MADDREREHVQVVRVPGSLRAMDDAIWAVIGFLYVMIGATAAAIFVTSKPRRMEAANIFAMVALLVFWPAALLASWMMWIGKSWSGAWMRGTSTESRYTKSAGNSPGRSPNPAAGAEPRSGDSSGTGVSLSGQLRRKRSAGTKRRS